MNLEDHPTVRHLRLSAHDNITLTGSSTQAMNAAELRGLALECGADDAGLIEIARPRLDPQRDEILRNYPWTQDGRGER
jgi:hypothetical protein